MTPNTIALDLPRGYRARLARWWFWAKMGRAERRALRDMLRRADEAAAELWRS